MKRVRVEIDLNARNAEGLTVTKLTNVNGEISKGQLVTAFESEDEVQALAMVSRIDRVDGFVYLHVNWDSICEDVENEVRVPTNLNATNRAQALVANRHAASTGAVRPITRNSYLALPTSLHGRR